MSGWINQTETDFLKARSEAIRTVKTALEAAGFALPEPIYRLRFDAGAALPAIAEQGAKSETKPAPARPAAETMPGEEVTNTHVDEAVLKKVDEEREQQTGADLLSSNGQDELGTRPTV